MDSATARKAAEHEKQAEIRRKIALLQAQLSGDTLTTTTTTPSVGRQSTTSSTPKAAPRPPTRPSFPLKTDTKPTKPPPPPAPSTLLQKLAQAHKAKDQTPLLDTVVRSTAFTAAPATIVSPDPDNTDGCGRDENLALVEELSLGPVDHKPPFDDPHFEKLEPNSGIRLSSRVTPHDDFQAHLEGRYYISPSRLYSVVRLLPNKQGYDVPVFGDWLTIAVVGERGKMKYTQAPVGVTRDDKPLQDDEDRVDELPALDNPPQAGPSSRPPPFRRKPKEEPARPSGKKYVNMKLIDFGCRSAGSSADGGKAKIRGDAFLSLLLFESDTCDVLKKEDGKAEKIYRGGSRGAFERMSKLREGAVVALLNPKILKPFQRSTDKPHPTDNILALTPESDASIAIIGYAQDLGKCRATKRDGTRCTGWCDKRVSDVCDYHIQNAVERKRAARPEFAIGTGGMSSQAKKKQAYDPARQWGLKPEHEAAGATYVVHGHLVSGSDSRSLYVGETVGRDAQAKAARKLSAVDSEKMLQQLLKRDKEGTKALASAREFSKRKAEAPAAKDGARSKKRKVQQSEAGSEDEHKHNPAPRKNAYSAQLIKQLGFDPTAKDGRRVKDVGVQGKLDALAAAHATRTIELGPRPGKKSSCVRRPSPGPVVSCSSSSTSFMITRASVPATHNDLEYADEDDSPLHIPDSDDELEQEKRATSKRPAWLPPRDGLVDLDDSDNDT
ncbi:hypothetical protein C8Q78DRAFT_1067200 [Trametes maxima]|nr:hypothetical protein C8Q78DRAFT_1067200 [Trametes maxima]